MINVNIVNNDGEIVEEYKWIRNYGFIVIPHRLTSASNGAEYYSNILKGGKIK